MVAEKVKEWYTYEELAALLGVALSRIQRVMPTLIRGGLVSTRNSPTDLRTKEVHRDSIPVLRKYILGEQQ